MNGYRFSLQDNDSYAFREPPAREVKRSWQKLHQTLVPDMSGAPLAGVRCDACGDLLDKWNESLEGVRIKKRRYDLSCTYDGVHIASERFRKFIEKHAIEGLEFRALPSDPEFHKIRPSVEVPYDAVKRGTRFLNPCPACGRCESVVGATPVCLKQETAIPDRGFVRTDLEFGNGDAKHPLILCGEEAARLLGSSDLKGVDVFPLSYIPA